MLFLYLHTFLAYGKIYRWLFKNLTEILQKYNVLTKNKLWIRYQKGKVPCQNWSHGQLETDRLRLFCCVGDEITSISQAHTSLIIPGHRTTKLALVTDIWKKSWHLLLRFYFWIASKLSVGSSCLSFKIWRLFIPDWTLLLVEISYD